MTIPNFSQLYQNSSPTTPTTPAPSNSPVQDAGTIPDFSKLLEPATDKSPAEIQSEQLKASRDKFYDSVGIPKGALRGALDIVPSFADFIGQMSDPETRNAVLGSGLVNAGSGLMSMATHPIESIEHVPQMVGDLLAPFVKQPLELTVNNKLSWGNLFDLATNGPAAAARIEVAPLSNDDREQLGREIGINVLSLVTGAKAEEVVATKIAGQEAIVGAAGLDKLREGIVEASKQGILTAARTAEDPLVAAASDISSTQLLNLSRTGQVPSFLTRTLPGQAAGIVGGGTLGILQEGAPENRVSSALTFAAMAAPIGLGMSMMGEVISRARGMTPKADMAGVIAQQAAEIAKFRVVKNGLDQPLAEILFNNMNLQEQQKLSAAFAINAIEYTHTGVDKNGTPVVYGKNARIIPGVENPSEILSLLAEHNINSEYPDKLAIVHVRKDGLNDIMIAPHGMTTTERAFFEKTGYARGQQISYGGNEHWVIDDAGIPDGKRQFRMNLRNLVTDERVNGVGPKDIVRLSSNEPGDLGIYLGRQITRDDIYDPGQGFAHGKNTLTDKDLPQDPNEFFDFALAHASVFVSEPGNFPKVDFLPEGNKGELSRELRSLRTMGAIRELTPAEKARIADIEDVLTNSPFARANLRINGRALEPGLNNIKHPDGSSGALIYIGGKEETVVGADGKATKVTVGIPGEIVAALTYSEEAIGESARMVKGSHDFYSRAASPNRGIATEAIKAARAKEGILISHSSLSEQGSGAFKNARNSYAPDRQIGSRLTVDTPESLKKEILNSFLDHVGLSPEGNFMSGDDILARIGFAEYEGEGWKWRGHPGESLSTVGNRIPSDRYHLYTGSPDVSVKVWSDAGKPLSIDEARARLNSQVAADAVPTTHQMMDRPVNFNDMPFNDMVNSFIESRGINPEAAPAVHTYLQSEIGKILLDLPNATSRLADRSTLPMLEDMVNRAKRTVDELSPQEQHLSERDAQRLQDARETKDAFKARIDQIKTAEPLPFNDQERTILARLQDETKQMREDNLRDLASVAVGNGFAVDYHEGGKIRLTDRETGMDMGHAFDSPEQAIDFINNTGKAKGVDIDGGGNNVVPPASVMGVMPAPESPNRLLAVPHQFAPNTRVSAISQFINTVAPWYTPFREFAVALDNGFGSKLYSDVYLPTQTALMKLQAVRHPYMKLLSTIDEVIRGTTKDPERRKIISDYRETMSPQEVVDKLFTHRKLNNTETAYAQRLVDKQIRINDVFSYRRAVGEMKREFDSQEADLAAQMKNAPDDASKQALSAKIVELNASHSADVESAKKAFNMDEEHLKAVDMFEEITNRDPNDASLYGVTRLARAIQNGEVSRPEFAAKNKMTGSELSAAKQLDSFYSLIGKEQQIPENINGYLNHFRAYTDIPETAPAKFRQSAMRGALKDSPQLASELIRSGEMNVYERDPVRAAVQYVNSVTASRHFNDVWTQARDKAVQELNRVTKGRRAATDVVEKYIYGIKGIPEASDKLAQAGLDRFMEAMGSDLRPDIRRDVLNTFLSAGSGAFLGFRVAQGVRDFTQFSKGYFSRFGASRWNNGLSLAFQRDANGVMAIHKLAESGTIPGLSVLPFMSENELSDGLVGKAGSKVKDVIMNASRIGLDVSGQHNAYALAHAIAYLDTRDLASKTLLDLTRGKITKDIAYKRLSMNSYDIPVAEGFDRLVSEGKVDQAVEYLAQSTGAETAFIFGLHNHPYGWGTVPGKIASMFGTWSVWDRTMLLRLAGRGTAAERAAAMARFAMAETATGLAGKAIGLNMRSWYMIPGMLFFGGPAFDYLQQFEDMTGMRGAQRQAVAQKQLTTVKNGQLPIVGNLIPGSMAFSDYVKAYQMVNKHYGPVPILAQGLGFPVDRTQRSWLDSMMGNYPQTSKQ